MQIKRKRKSFYAKQLVFDTLAVLCGLAILALGIFTFIDPRERTFLFPVIFLLAAAFQVILAIPNLTAGYGRANRKLKRGGAGHVIFAFVLIALAVVGVICLWR